MPDYDAFGREIGEDPLAEWRQGSTAVPPQPRPEPEKAPRGAAAPAATVTAGDPLGAPSPLPTDAPPPPRRASALGTPRRGRRPGVRLVVVLVILWVGFNLVGTLVDKVGDAVNSIDVPDVSSEPDPPPTGLAQGSLLRPAAFGRAMAEVERRNIGKVQSIRVAPERINPTLLTPKGTLVVVQVTPDGEFQRFSESGTGFGGLETIPYDRIDPLVPQRLTRAAAERLGKPVSQIDYLVPSMSQGKVSWGAYFKDGSIVMANEHGRSLRRIS